MNSPEEPLGYVQSTFNFEYDSEPPEKEQLRRLHEGLAPYLDTHKLRRLVAQQQDVHEALRSNAPPAEVLELLATLSALLRPPRREQIKSPADVAGLLMVEMGHLDQEELRTVLLDTKNRLQDIVTVYRGSLNSSLIRVGKWTSMREKGLGFTR